MEPVALQDETHGQTSTNGDPVSDSTVLEDAQSLWHELSGLIHDRFLLAALETRRAGESLVSMIMLGVMVAVLLGCTWLELMVAAVLALVDNGVVLGNAILLAGAFTLLFALILFGVMRRKSRYLQFPVTSRSLHTAYPRNTETRKS